MDVSSRPASRYGKLLFVAGALLLVLVSGCDQKAATDSESDAAAEKQRVIQSPNDTRAYRAVTLENGIEVLLVSDPAVEKSAAALSVGVGLMFDPMAYQGMAHFLEHMLFMGTEAYPDIDGYMTYINENGGSRNAYTWLDITNYMFEIKNSAYEGALDRFSHFFKTPLLDPEYIEKEKSAVNAEWSMRREMDYFGMFKLGRGFMGDHPANRFLIGNLESLADKEGSTLHDATVDFYQRYYGADIMKVALVSDQGLGQMEVLAERYFGDIPVKNIEKPAVTTPLNFDEAAGKLVRYVPLEDQRMLQLDFFIDANNDQFRVKPNRYLSYILGSEMPDTPASKLKELGWASSLMATASPNEFGNYGTFSIQVDLTEAGMAHREEITHVILGYLEMLRAEGVDDRYAEELRTSLDNQFRFLEKINDFSYVSSLAASLQNYPIENVINASFVFDGFDADAVNSVLAQLVPERMNVWYVSKDEPVTETMHFYAGRYAVEPLQIASTDEQLALVSEYGLSQPALNTLLPESFEVAHGPATPEKLISTDGMEVWLQGSETFPEQPKGFTQVYLNTDTREADAASEVMYALWTDLYNLSQMTLFTEASIAGMNVGASSGFGLRFTVSGFTNKQPELLKRAAEALRIQPTSLELEQAVDRYLRGLENARYGFAVRQLFPAVQRLTQSGQYSRDSLIAAASEVTPESLREFIEQELSTSYVRIYLFGNYSASYATELSELLTSTLSAGDNAGYVRPKVYAPQKGDRIVYQEELPIEDLGMLYLFAAPEPSIENLARGELVSAHLSSRAFNQLRTEEQLGYAAGGFATELGDYPMLGLYIQTPVKAPVDMLARFDAYRTEFAKDFDSLTEEDFERIKAGVLTTLTEPPKNLSEEASPFVSDWTRERYSFDTRARLIKAVQAVSLSEAQAYYRDTMLAEDSGRILIQLKGTKFADAPFAALPDGIVVDDVDAFHQQMPAQVR